MKKYLTEFVGTFFLVLTIGLTVASGTPFAPVAIGSILMVMVYMGGHISGAHYNPAATLGFLMRGRIDRVEAVKYVIFQIVGACLAAFVSYWMVDATFAPAPVGGTVEALAAELLFTFALVLVILNVATADETEGNSYFGLAIGVTVMGGVFAVGEISGAAFNPAVGLGFIAIDTITGDGSFGDIWIYLVGPLSGGALAVPVFNMQHR